jgi:hypothetical protein
MLEQIKITEIVNILTKIFGFQLKESLHLHQIAFQFISLCFSCV